MRFISRKRVGIVLVAVTLLVGAYLIVIQPMSEQKNRTQVTLAQHQDFVIATGRVEARDDVTLSFEGGGSVFHVARQAGGHCFQSGRHYRLAGRRNFAGRC